MLIAIEQQQGKMGCIKDIHNMCKRHADYFFFITTLNAAVLFLLLLVDHDDSNQ